MAKFQIGQKIECVNDQPMPPAYLPVKGIRKGGIYTFTGYGNRGGVLIAEATALHECEGSGWIERRFKPVRQRQTDISLFNRMLKEQSKAVKA